MNPVVGRYELTIGRRVRRLALDMRAVAVLYDEVGDGWAEWLAERFAGREMEAADGTRARVAAEVPAADLGVMLYALTVSDRRGGETATSLLKGMGRPARLAAQELVLLVVAPSFGLPGQGLRVPKGGKAREWSWRRIVQTALGVMGLAPDVFWSLTLAEWRALSEGYAVRRRDEMRRAAWSLSHLLIAAGCKPDAVTVAKLLGEKERATRAEPVAEQLSVDEIYRRMRGEAVNG